MPPLRPLLHSWERADTGVGLVVDGVFAYFTKIAKGEAFMVLIARSDASRVMSPSAVAFHQEHARGHPEGRYIVGRIKGPGGDLDLGQALDTSGIAITPTVTDEVTSSPAIADPVLGGFVASAAAALDRYLANLGQWPRFQDFLGVVAGKAVGSDDPGVLPGLPYRWLVSMVNPDRGVFPIGAYQGDNAGYGIVVNEDGLLPIYSSHLHGALAGDLLAAHRDMPVVPDMVACLGCYLNGVSGELGPSRIRGALLNDQWKIDFLTCSAHSPPSGAKVASHFRISDGDDRYVLTGCPDEGSSPRFVNERWKSQAPPPDTCGPRLW